MSVLFPDKDVDSITRKARRSFMRFIEAGGGNADQLKDDNGNMYFDEQEAVYVEAILKQLISQKLGRVLPVVEMYRTLPNKNKEVLVRIAYSAKMAKAAAKNSIREDLEKESDELGKKLDELLGW